MNLTPRESEILQLLSDGLEAKEIGERLLITYRTVQTHIGNMLRKFDVHTSLHLVATALRIGVIK